MTPFKGTSPRDTTAMSTSMTGLAAIPGTEVLPTCSNRLDVQAIYSDGARQVRVHLRFPVTPPTRLASGTWNGFGSEAGVRERSSTFLGGQSGPPSIGGRFGAGLDHQKPAFRKAANPSIA